MRGALKLDEKILETLAAKYGVSVDDVKKEIRDAIGAAYVSPNPEALKVPRAGAVPTPDEIFAYALEKFNKNGR